jgi:hypothetical protein
MNQPPASPENRTYQMVPSFKGDESPSLEPSKHRISRAVQRLNELRDVIENVRARALSTPAIIRVERRLVDAGERPPLDIEWQHTPEDTHLQQQARLLTGETVYHLRTAFEYLAYHLVWLDNGRPFRGSAFPIVKDTDPKKWMKAKERIPGLTPVHLQQIRSLQPFAGCSWTGELSTLSNADKHRSPLRIRIPTVAVMPLTPPVLVPDPMDQTHYIVEAPAPPVEVTTNDGRDLHQLLRQITQRVAETVNSFCPDFGEPADLQFSVRRS